MQIGKKSAEKIRLERLEKEAARLAAMPTQDERFQAFILGATRSAARLRKIGETAKAEKIEALANEMAGALETLRTAKKAEAEPCAEPLKDAITAAAAELQKKLPSCFPCEADALAFAGFVLPLSAAKAEQTKLLDLRMKKARAVSETERHLWALVEKTAQLTGSGGAINVSLRELEKIGSV